MNSERTTSRNALNEKVMAELRGNGGRDHEGRTMVIVHAIGRTTGTVHARPMFVREDGDDLIVAASDGGHPTQPKWYDNMVANPEVTVEYLGQTFRARAEVVPNSVDRDRLFHKMSEEITDIYAYQDRCRDSRQIPIIRIRREGE